MVPRGDIVAVKRDISLGELMSLFESAAHSRLVVYNDTLDDPEGFVHIRDLLAFITAKAKVPDEVNAKRKKPFPAGLDLRAVDLRMKLSDADIMRKLIYVPPSMPAIDLLAQMQATRIHLALVVDEYGGTDGLVSIEDIVEQVVAAKSTTSMTATRRPSVVRQSDGSFIADARASLEDVTSVVGRGLRHRRGRRGCRYARRLSGHAGRPPAGCAARLFPGLGDFEIEVLDADPRRVKRVRIGTHKDRSNLRHRETRRREAANDAGQAPVTDPGSPASSNDGAARG